MLRRFLGLLIALALALASPPFGAVTAMPPGMTATTECACPNADQDCGEHGKMGCNGALACAVQCGIAMPMLGNQPAAWQPVPIAGPRLVAAAALPVSATTAPPLRPPTASIPA